MIVFATYQVKKENTQTFVKLLKECEIIMRNENLITTKPIYRMQSILNEEFIIEVFEWENENSFQDAQKNSNVLKMWMQYENNWIKGGFGIDQLPEAAIPWAQFRPIE